MPTQKSFLDGAFKEFCTLYILIGVQLLGHCSVLMSLHHDDSDKLYVNLESFLFSSTKNLANLPSLPWCIKMDYVGIW